MARATLPLAELRRGALLVHLVGREAMLKEKLLRCLHTAECLHKGSHPSVLERLDGLGHVQMDAGALDVRADHEYLRICVGTSIADES